MSLFFSHQRNLKHSLPNRAVIFTSVIFKYSGSESFLKQFLFKQFLFSVFCLCQVSVIFFLLRKFPPSVFALSFPPALIEDLRVSVLVPMDAMLMQLLSFHPFAESVLDPGHRKRFYHNNRLIIDISYSTGLTFIKSRSRCRR